MSAPDPVQAVAEALHADQCPDDECDGSDMGEFERAAEVAIAAARPLIEREAKAALIEEVKRLQDQIARARMEPGQDRQKAMHGYAERAEQTEAERDALAARLAAEQAASVTYADQVSALAARLAAVEALADHWQYEEMPDPATADRDLRAALATGTEGQT